MRSLSSVPRSRVSRRRSSCSGLGARTMEQTRRSPRAQAISVRNSVSPSIASVLALRCRRAKQAMEPKSVQSRFLNDDRSDLRAIALTGLRSRARKKVEQAGAVSALDHMLGKLLAARPVDRHNPFRFAQFERGEQRDIMRAGGGRDSGRGGDRLHRLPPGWRGSSAYQVRPPSTRIGSFSALFTLWLSMMAAVGLASRSACSRHFWYSASWM